MMTKWKWNLEEIFSNNQLFYEEIENIKKLINDIKQYENIELDSIVLLNILDKKWKIKELVNNVLIYGSLMYYKNINDDECIELKKVAENFNNEVNNILKFVDKKILDLGFEKVSSFIFENSMFHFPPFRPVSAHRCCAFCCAVIPHQAIVFSSGSWSVRTRRHSRGVMPFSRLNIAAKRLGLSYPTRCAISKMLKSVVKSSCSACCTRQRRR